MHTLTRSRPALAAGTSDRHAGMQAPDRAATARPAHTFHLPTFALENGAVLRDVRQAYHFDGALDAARTNVVLVLHALTGDADAAGGWWRDVIGPGRAIDTTRHAVLAPNLLGSCYGTTTGDGAATATPITTRDQARLAVELARGLGVRGFTLVTAGRWAAW